VTEQSVVIPQPVTASQASCYALSHVISFLLGRFLRLVLDTDVLVAALPSEGGACRRLLLGAFDGAFELLASVPLIVEYEAVLTRPEHLEVCGLTAGEVNDLLDAVVKVSRPVDLRFLWRPRLKDPADEMVLETAVNGAADWLVTFNMRHLGAAVREFGVRALLPRDAWKEIRRREAK
jgi:putative PIN family toxin of toxin-antitoxin system